MGTENPPSSILIFAPKEYVPPKNLIAPITTYT